MNALSSIILIISIVIVGGLVAAQGPIFARMAIHAGGSLPAAFIAFALGLIFITIINLLFGSSLPRLENLQQAPFWVWFGGIIGAIMVLLSIYAVPKIGVAAYMSAAICGQLIAAIIFDHFGLFGLVANPINGLKITGVCLMLLGLSLITF